MAPVPRILVAVLAAGEATRMGVSKLTLPYLDDAGQKTCLLEHAVRIASEVASGEVVVVTGGHSQEVEAAAARIAGVRTCPNPRWTQGQGTSVACAARYASDHGFDGLLVMTADQPHLQAKHLRRLVDESCADAHPRAYRSAAGQRRGNPCLFSAGAFGLLEGLAGNEGARTLFAQGLLHATDVAIGEDPALLDDIDTPAQFARLAAQAAPRADFPLLNRTAKSGATLAYLDSSATALVPEPVRAAIDAHLVRSRSNVHRGAHLLAEEATDAYERAREHVAVFLQSPTPEQVILTSGTTASLNLVAQAWGEAQLAAGDTVVLTEEAHHAAIVPFQMLARRKGLNLHWVRVNEHGLLDPASWQEALATRPKLVVLTHTSNVLGYTQPLFDRMAREAHEAGALVAVDAAQAAGHLVLSVAQQPWDFVAFSGHKLGSLTGIGALWCSPRALGGMRPAAGGGGMIESVSLDGFTAAPVPWCFEAGTPPIEAAVSLDAALGYLEGQGLDALETHSRSLALLATHGLARIPGVRVLGAIEQPRTALVSFALDRVHPHDASARLSDQGVLVRAGHHCAMPLHRALGVPASLRASLGVHTTIEDVERLVSAVRVLAQA